MIWWVRPGYLGELIERQARRRWIARERLIELGIAEGDLEQFMFSMDEKESNSLVRKLTNKYLKIAEKRKLP